MKQGIAGVLGAVVFAIMYCSSLVLGQPVSDNDLWQQIQYYANPSTEDKALLKNCYAQLSTLYPNSPILDQALYFYSQYWERKGLQNDTVKLCKRIINTYPNSSYVYPAYLDIMRIYQERENTAGLTQIYAEFKAYTEKYLQNPTLSAEHKAEVYLHLGYYAQVLKQPKLAQSAFLQAYQLAPNTESGKKAFYYTGLSYLSERTYTGASAALSQFHSVINQYPGDIEANNSQFYIALVKHRIGDKDGALIGFNSFIEQNPDSEYTPRALYLSGMSYAYNRHEYPKAITYFDKTIDWLTTHSPLGEDPKFISGIDDELVTSGLLYHSCEQKAYAYLNFYGADSALAWGKELQSIFPSERGMHQFGKLVPLIVLQKQRRWEELYNASVKLIDTYTDDTRKWVTVPSMILYLQGYALEQMGKESDAVMVYNKLLQRYPKSSGAGSEAALMRLGEYYLRTGSYVEMINTYDRLLEQCADGKVIAACYLNKVLAVNLLYGYHDAIDILTEFIQVYGDRFDIPKELIVEAKIILENYRAQLGFLELSDFEMQRLYGGNACLCCGLGNCGCTYKPTTTVTADSPTGGRIKQPKYQNDKFEWHNGNTYRYTNQAVTCYSAYEDAKDIM